MTRDPHDDDPPVEALMGEGESVWTFLDIMGVLVVSLIPAVWGLGLDSSLDGWLRTIAVVAAVVGGGTGYMALGRWRPFGRWLDRRAARLGLVMVPAGWLFGAPLLVNRFADGGVSVHHDVAVDDRLSKRGRIVYQVASWRPGETSRYLALTPGVDVDPALRDADVPKRLRVIVKPGALGAPWIEALQSVPAGDP